MKEKDMIKKIFKILLKTFIVVILLAFISYWSFLSWEYVTGGKYVSYLKANSETVSIDEQFTYNLAKEDIEKSKLILVGEIHGFKEPTKFDFDFFKYLNKNYSVTSYFAELDFVQATLLNTYLKSGDEDLLKAVLKNWVVIQGRNNKDYFDKYVHFKEYYQQLPENQKFQFIGIDKIQDKNLILKYVNNLSAVDSSLVLLNPNKENYMVQIKNRIATLSTLYQADSATEFILEHLSRNLNYVENKTNRESVMFQNFKELYNKYGLNSKKSYGYFGLYHIFQYRVNGRHPLASQIRKSDLGLENKILSINFLMNDSYIVMPSDNLPEFLRDKGKYTRMPVSADNVLFMYIYGIKDFKRATEENQKSFIKMNSANNPYSGSSRLNTTIQLLPVTDIFEMTDKGKPYIQYTVFVRNSDWAEPMK
jgi:hypothetical protein